MERRELDDGTQKPYYRKVGDEVLEQAKSEILACLDKAHKAGIISDHEYKHMNPSEKVAGRFYALPKVHKDHEPGQVPPLRSIISGSGSITECISQYVQDKIKDLSKLHPAWLEDTPHLLRELDPLDSLPDTAILVTVDVSSLYSNIQREDGVEAVRKVLKTRKDKSIPSDFILELLDLVLKFNIFEFDSQLWQQLIGTAMGTRAAPNVADIFMSFIDQEIIKRAQSYAVDGVSPLVFYKRFLDDILMIWLGSHHHLHSFVQDINKINPSIKFSLEHTKKLSDPDHDSCPCPLQDSVPFLDTSLSVRNGHINSDLYRKKTDRCQYLLPSSCHPPHCSDNIPFSLALRIIRICTDTGERVKRLEELRDMLLSGGYKRKLINNNIEKALLVSRPRPSRRLSGPSPQSLVSSTRLTGLWW